MHHDNDTEVAQGQAGLHIKEHASALVDQIRRDLAKADQKSNPIAIRAKISKLLEESAHADLHLLTEESAASREAARTLLDDDLAEIIG